MWTQKPLALDPLSYSAQYTALRKKTSGLTSPNIKEQRQFPVLVHPPFHSIVQGYAFRNHLISYVPTEEISCHYNVFASGVGRQHLAATEVCDILNAGPKVASLNCELGVESIKVQLSNKTSPDLQGRKSGTTKAVWNDIVELTGGERHAPTIQELLVQTRQQDLLQILEKPLLDTEFFKDLITLVASHENVVQPLAPSDRWDAFKEAHKDRESLLELKTVEYFNRGESRAYVADSALVRPLVGACLQSIFLPHDIKQRTRLPTNHVNPSLGKNILDKVVYAPNENSSALFVVSDTSSFSSSGLNQWVGLLTLLILAETGDYEYLEQCFHFDIGGGIFTASIHELLKLYLYTTVGVACTDLVTGWEYVSQGGYLGVNGNNVTGLLAQSILLISLHSQRDISFFQSGGDDIASLIVAATEGIAREVRVHVYDELTKYNGIQKEFSVCDLRELEYGETILDVEFCKKKVRVVKILEDSGRVQFQISSVYEMPILGTLLVPRTQQNHKPLESQISEARSAIKSGCANLDTLRVESEEFLTSLFALSRGISVLAMRQRYATHKVRGDRDALFVSLGARMISQKAFAWANTVPSLHSVKGHIRTSTTSKLKVLFHKEVVKVVTVDRSVEEGGSVDYVCTKREANELFEGVPHHFWNLGSEHGQNVLNQCLSEILGENEMAGEIPNELRDSWFVSRKRSRGQR